MADNALAAYLDAINKAHLRGDDTEHTHRPALKDLIESFGKKLTATNEPSRIACGSPDTHATIITAEDGCGTHDKTGAGYILYLIKEGV
jgi:hypothetical protein